MYVEELIGPETVNTMPLETIEAFQDHGEVRGDTVLEGIDEAHAAAAEARATRASTTTTSRTRSKPRASQKFSDSFDEIVDSIRAKRSTLAAA